MRRGPRPARRASSRACAAEGIVLRRDFGVLTVSVQAKKGLVTKKDRQAFLSALWQMVVVS